MRQSTGLITMARLMRALLVTLLPLALLVPGTRAHAEALEINFQAGYSGTGQLTVCGDNTYCISDQASGRATGLGASTLTANETEQLVDPTSPCGFEVQGTATLADLAGDSLALAFTLHTCGFGTDSGATIVKLGSFTVTGGTGSFAGASGGGSVYKIGLIPAPTSVFGFRGRISGGAAQLGGDAVLPTLGGANCDIANDGIRCWVATTNTIASYPAAQCGTTTINGQYVLQDRYRLAFDANGLAVLWNDLQQAAGTFSNAGSGTTVPFMLNQTLDILLASPGGFSSATTAFSGPGLTFEQGNIPALPPSQIAYDSNGRITLGASPTLTQLCAAYG